MDPAGPVGLPPSVSVFPVQSVLFPPELITGSGFTFTETVPVFEHPADDVTVTVYTVEVVGVATGFEIVELLNPPEGLHEYVLPPLPESETGSPAHTVLFGPAATVTDWIDTFNVRGAAAHPFLLYAVTEMLPLGPLPQFTLTVLVPCPDKIVPPVAVQVNEVPLAAETLYVPGLFEQIGLSPEIEVGPVYGRTCMVYTTFVIFGGQPSSGACTMKK